MYKVLYLKGVVRSSGLTSIQAGMKRPDMVKLRKKKNIRNSMKSGSDQPTLFTVYLRKELMLDA